MNISMVQLLRAPPLICKSVLVWIINYMVAYIREETGQHFSQESIRGSLPIGQLSRASQRTKQVWLCPRYVQCPEPHSPPPLSLASWAWVCSPRTAAAGRVPAAPKAFILGCSSWLSLDILVRNPWAVWFMLYWENYLFSTSHPPCH